MSMTTAEAGRLGGQASARAKTPEQRREHARRARFERTVNTIVRRAGELTEDQKDRILDALFPGTGDAA